MPPHDIFIQHCTPKTTEMKR